METLLKKPVLRDSMGRFDRHGKALAKTGKKTGLINNQPGADGRGGARPGAGRPRGASGKATIQLREAVLSALDKLGGDDYLVALGRENSSAFASLLNKVLPTQLSSASETDGGVSVKLEFRRIICWPDGREEIENVSPKQLPAPASNALLKPTDPTDDTNEGTVR
jgi:hypothetical protein